MSAVTKTQPQKRSLGFSRLFARREERPYVHPYVGGFLLGLLLFLAFFFTGNGLGPSGG